MSDRAADILIVGGGTGGCAAAMAAASMGLRIIVTEVTDWIGGQLTAQAVPPDEHPWIEQSGCTRRYRQYRDGVRQYYRDHYPLSPEARANPRLNPGAGNVSRICHEPRVGLAVLESMMQYRCSTGRLAILLRREPVAVEADGDSVHAVTFKNLETGDRETIAARYILDATELGDLLPLARAEYVSGAESRDETGEPHAVAGPAQPDNVQSFTWCFPMAFDPGGDHVGDPPRDYATWRDYVPNLTPPWTGRLLSWTASYPGNLKPTVRNLFPEEGPHSLWLFRRIVAREHYPERAMPHEVTLVNWPMNDYWEGNIIDKPAKVVAEHLDASKQLSLALFHWLQTEAPRPDGGTGYPGLYLRPDITGTDDGLAKYPYIRESRRIRALFSITENHVGTDARREHGYAEAETFPDSVGLGCYRIDLHPSAGGTNYIDISSLPFQIPLGALIPVRVENLLPACKNIGTTHIANGCYRLHPVEWNIGEAAGLLAAFCLAKKVPPRAVRERPERLKEFQDLLVGEGIELEWPRTRPV